MTSTQVEQFLQNLNDAWLTRDYARLALFYHPDVVLLPPDAGTPLLGREAVLATYRDFHAACQVERFTVTEQASWQFSYDALAEPEAAVVVPAETAITTMVHMRFAIDYRFSQSTLTGETNQGSSTVQTEAQESLLQSEQGMDVYTLTQATAHSDPKIIWRAQFTL